MNLRNRISFLLLFFAGIAVSMRAQDAMPAADTVTYRVPEVVVTGLKRGVDLKKSTSAAKVLDHAGIESVNGATVAAVLDAAGGGLVRSYGGGEGIRTVSIRGMGPEHTLVLIDGKRYSDMQNNQTDLSLISSETIDRIEVIRGGFSSLFGADAVGGVVNIVTKRASSGGHGSASVGLGSYGAREWGIEGSYGSSDISLRFYVAQSGGDGNFEFRFADPSAFGRELTVRRKNADYLTVQSGFSLDAAWSEDHTSSFSLRALSNDRGSPGVYSGPSAESKARLRDEDYFYQFDHTWKFTETAEASIDIAWREAVQRYADPLVVAGARTTSSRHENRMLTVAPSMHLKAGEYVRMTAGIEAAGAWLHSTDVSGNPERRQWSAYCVPDVEVPAGTILPLRLTITPSVRYDWYSDFTGGASARIGINVGLLREPEVFVRAGYGSSYQAPTFNQLYWVPGGNPHLNPERSVAADAGIGISGEWIAAWRFTADVFDVRTRDLVSWLPGSQGIWTPVNVYHARSRGLELNGTATLFNGSCVLSYDHAFTDARQIGSRNPSDPNIGKRLMYVPGETVRLAAGFRWYQFECNISERFTSYRYSTPDNDDAGMMPSFAVTDANVVVHLAPGDARVTLRFEVNNIFDRSYQSVAGYPVPMRTFMARVSAGI